MDAKKVYLTIQYTVCNTFVFQEWNPMLFWQCMFLSHSEKRRLTKETTPKTSFEMKKVCICKFVFGCEVRDNAIILK